MQCLPTGVRRPAAGVNTRRKHPRDIIPAARPGTASAVNWRSEYRQVGCDQEPVSFTLPAPTFRSYNLMTFWMERR